jgi:hypothetical protein
MPGAAKFNGPASAALRDELGIRDVPCNRALVDLGLSAGR